MNQLKTMTLQQVKLENGRIEDRIDIAFQLFGQELHTAPVVLVNHALTGNSNIAGEFGWWRELAGPGKLIDTNRFTVIGINIVGNGTGTAVIKNYSDYTVRDNAKFFINVLRKLEITSLHSIIGGSIGGAIAWEMAITRSDLAKNIIPIATHWKASDWILGQCFVQKQILNSSKQPLNDARMMSMLFYRTAESFRKKFGNKKDENGKLKVESWLAYHGKSLSDRYSLQAYKMMNHLLTTIDVTKNRLEFKELVKSIKSKIIQISIDSDLFFVPDDIRETACILEKMNKENEYHEIQSVHGHDAFLIEFETIHKILKPVFT